MRDACPPPRRLGDELEIISVRVPEAARMTGLCRSKIFALIASGELETVKIGKARIILVDSLKAFLRARAYIRGSDGAGD